MKKSINGQVRVTKDKSTQRQSLRVHLCSTNDASNTVGLGCQMSHYAISVLIIGPMLSKGLGALTTVYLSTVPAKGALLHMIFISLPAGSMPADWT